MNKGLNTISTDIDWSKYTNLQNVIVTSNNMRIVKDILPALPSGINLLAVKETLYDVFGDDIQLIYDRKKKLYILIYYKSSFNISNLPLI